MAIEIKYIMNYVESHEGRSTSVYKDVYGNRTIGVGHKIVCEKYQDSTMISNEEIDFLFIKDISAMLKTVIYIFPKYNTYPLYIKASIIDGFFRGDLSGSPKTIKLINEGKWLEASKEYLDNKEYISAKNNKSGVWKRMLENSHHFLNYSEELNNP